MVDSVVSQGIARLRQRTLAEGGFANHGNGAYRSDATAWAVLALIASGQEQDEELISRARRRLAADQLPDGRVCLAAGLPEIYWPTPLAILAWHQSPAHQESLAQAAQFLLTHSGRQWETKPDSPEKHDYSLRGWPWATATYSWVAPTALGIMALKAAGYGDHPRVAEARHLLLDRECLHGGWNYGNRLVFGAELRPMPEDTGIALNALQGSTVKSELAASLAYLASVVKGLRTPVGLGWSLLGLGAWGERPAAAPAWLGECWQRQQRYGDYDTMALSLLLVAACASGGLESVFRAEPVSLKG